MIFRRLAPIMRRVLGCSVLLLISTLPLTVTPALAQDSSIYLPLISQTRAAPVRSGACNGVNGHESQLMSLIQNHSNQQRDFMVCNPILAAVARARAIDMANRPYDNHTDPDGKGPNTWVRIAGYPLPAYYSTESDANNIESLVTGTSTAADTLAAWLSSNTHDFHVLGKSDFYRNQVEFGVGYHADEKSPGKFYWIFISAESADPG